MGATGDQGWGGLPPLEPLAPLPALPPLVAFPAGEPAPPPVSEEVVVDDRPDDEVDQPPDADDQGPEEHIEQDDGAPARVAGSATVVKHRMSGSAPRPAEAVRWVAVAADRPLVADSIAMVLESHGITARTVTDTGSGFARSGARPVTSRVLVPSTEASFAAELINGDEMLEMFRPPRWRRDGQSSRGCVIALVVVLVAVWVWILFVLLG